MPVEVAESPGLTVALTVVIPPTVPVAAEGRAGVGRDVADGAVDQQRAGVDDRRQRAVVGLQAERALALLGQPRSSRRPRRSGAASPAELSTVTVPAPGLKVIGRVIVEPLELCEESIDPARPMPSPVIM